MSSRDGTFVRKCGILGSDDGQFCGTIGVCVVGDQVFLLLKTEMNRNQVFRRDGTFVRKFGTKGSGD